MLVIVFICMIREVVVRNINGMIMKFVNGDIFKIDVKIVFDVK